MSPSRFVFSPDPVEAVQAYGQDHGKALKRAADALVRRWKKTPPTGKFLGPLHKALKVDDDLLARTLLGTMTGFLPPADAALRWAIYDWTENDELWRVQQTLAGSSEPNAFKRAKLLQEPLVRTMQKRPAPDLVWRTATAAAAGHKLGGIDLRENDRIIVGIAGATFRDPAPDPTPIFGGDKTAAPSSHACPAYKFAMGTMLGILSALLERGRLETLPAPLIVKLTDTQPRAGPRQPAG